MRVVQWYQGHGEGVPLTARHPSLRSRAGSSPPTTGPLASTPSEALHWVGAYPPPFAFRRFLFRVEDKPPLFFREFTHPRLRYRNTTRLLNKWSGRALSSPWGALGW